ncbi:YaiI/YqxD family protein [Phenylobacterium aquaticum]|uniref:YaiI/YqxD family protein n=1 Tax=Phenylobacterium aquaticum TaxID=1763816 RepID=UPI0023515908|nr:YaiI/YqxD family protein [Phenylobacterium aquaticum]
MTEPRKPIEIFIDADACPVKDEVYKVAQRYGLKTWVVSNAFMMIPTSPMIVRVIVDAGPDVADDWIAERAMEGDVVITNDIPLADRALKNGAHVLAGTGKPFTPDSIGSALAHRAIMEQLRSTGEVTGGPKPFDRKDRSRFLQALDEVINRERRRRG